MKDNNNNIIVNTLTSFSLDFVDHWPLLADDMSFGYNKLMNSDSQDSLDTVWSSTSSGQSTINDWVTGLDNLGNTCFMNAILQCLAHTDPLRHYIISNQFLKDLNKSDGMTAYHLALLFRKLWSNKCQSIRPTQLKALVERSQMFSLRGQQDAHEYCIFLLDSLHEDLNRARSHTFISYTDNNEDEELMNGKMLASHSWSQFKKNNDSIITDLFYGQYASLIRCSICPKDSFKFDPFMCLSLPIPQHYDNIELRDCLSLFTASEYLSNQNSWYCPQCKQTRNAIKRISLWQLPKILVIQLKRFCFDENLCSEKITSFVNFPLYGLDLNPYCSNANPNCTYDLYGVVNHYGGVDGGHYTSYVKCSDNYYDTSIWRCFDDNRVDKVGDESMVTRNAYILFYRRRDHNSNL